MVLIKGTSSFNIILVIVLFFDLSRYYSEMYKINKILQHAYPLYLIRRYSTCVLSTFLILTNIDRTSSYISFIRRFNFPSIATLYLAVTRTSTLVYRACRTWFCTSCLIWRILLASCHQNCGSGSYHYWKCCIFLLTYLWTVNTTHLTHSYIFLIDQGPTHITLCNRKVWKLLGDISV